MKILYGENLIKALKSLVSDIESMKYKPHWSEDDGSWFGPFSESEEAGNLGQSVSVEWPNLAISLKDVKKALQEHEEG
jgi:hypothetical protein